MQEGQRLPACLSIIFLTCVYMLGLCVDRLVLMAFCSPATKNWFKQRKNTVREHCVHLGVCYFVCSVFSPLGSLSPLAPLWHKSARLPHCLRWIQAEDMTTPHTHNHGQQQTPPPHHRYLPCPTPGIPVTSPCLLRDFWDHIAYRSGALPPAIGGGMCGGLHPY